MTTTLTFHPKLGLRIPAKTLREAGFQPKKTFVITMNTPIIHIIPQQHDDEKEKDWLDEVLKTPEGKAYFNARADEASREYKDGKLHNIEDVFAEIEAERK
ncbi:MAG: hypothetical protein UW39_C0005G0036 [Parcubacteria group bacterium GW2011_GWC2_44_17]|uniref:Uncharacterized protein n=1 Tax=Candidatus Jacksonbacteria bacterium RIFCSPLOWO2_02_FULL_44_20 TaxID=1798460 RepID=A0A1G2AAX1_9BACT|nr:MAG: hypothetical protein UW39_C0005G0036 [Parcubacteria group bacterium GW2011_GWC2_44_17]KKT49305.1 MAG: hypothetical protein UW40_C0023G0025 [Parcubacteria group bacterium GW2011_GWF2_44_17]OGY71717.1 MAG: hypothetical protein A3E05_03270 [Candidatus Jacksonbacteria bacterium RIFCSPHIGHO2_12_FULL_44_12]OGY71877.1 MAG: hypothetical protein A3C00_01075 [Candidatus Jacksonbacteria bacterium RIFCSPHIGHO2_02_FULL_44_25]OGY73531.1 MAG: hypothetical protein A3H07_03800 [Candidatus Jacksonbacteri